MTFDRASMLSDVRDGLMAHSKHLPSKYFYDERGSILFDEITRLPEYYPTRAERALLERSAATIVAATRPATLVELGAGSSEKTRLLIDQVLSASVTPVTYIPVDVSTSFLESSAVQLRTEYPSLRISPLAADFSRSFTLPPHQPPTLHAFLGSTIGNFTPDAAIALITSLRERMTSGDFFLLGVDLRKDQDVIERAYNDSRGVTAEFNRNILSNINNVLGANFDTARFRHNAVYNTAEHRIEMRLISCGSQTVGVPGVGDVTLGDGEAILTELSYKYDRDDAAALLTGGGLKLCGWFTDDAGMFALALASR